MLKSPSTRQPRDISASSAAQPGGKRGQPAELVLVFFGFDGSRRSARRRRPRARRRRLPASTRFCGSSKAGNADCTSACRRCATGSRRRYRFSVRRRLPDSRRRRFPPAEIWRLRVLVSCRHSTSGWCCGKPVQHVRQADVQRIDVPGGELHCAGADVRWHVVRLQQRGRADWRLGAAAAAGFRRSIPGIGWCADNRRCRARCSSRFPR